MWGTALQILNNKNFKNVKNEIKNKNLKIMEKNGKNKIKSNNLLNCACGETKQAGLLKPA